MDLFYSFRRFQLDDYSIFHKYVCKVFTDALTFVIYGNWSDLLVGYWSSVDVLVNPFHADVYSKGSVKINALQDVDIAVRHPESFVISTGFVAG